MAYLFFSLLQGVFLPLQLTAVLLALFCGEYFLLEDALVQGTDFFQLLQQIGICPYNLGTYVHLVLQQLAQGNRTFVDSPDFFHAVVCRIFGQGQCFGLFIVVDNLFLDAIVCQVIFFRHKCFLGYLHLFLKISDGAVRGAEPELFISLQQLVFQYPERVLCNAGIGRGIYQFYQVAGAQPFDGNCIQCALCNRVACNRRNL